MPGEAIPALPKTAYRTPVALVADALLMRTADELFGHHPCPGTMVLNEGGYLLTDHHIAPHVDIRQPRLQGLGIAPCGPNDPHHNLGCMAEVRTIKRNRRHRPAAKTATRLLMQALLEFVARDSDFTILHQWVRQIQSDTRSSGPLTADFVPQFPLAQKRSKTAPSPHIECLPRVVACH